MDFLQVIILFTGDKIVKSYQYRVNYTNWELKSEKDRIYWIWKYGKRHCKWITIFRGLKTS